MTNDIESNQLIYPFSFGDRGQPNLLGGKGVIWPKWCESDHHYPQALRLLLKIVNRQNIRGIGSDSSADSHLINSFESLGLSSLFFVRPYVTTPIWFERLAVVKSIPLPAPVTSATEPLMKLNN